MSRQRLVALCRAVAFAALGVVFLYTAWGMPKGISCTIWNIFGVLDLLYAGWIASRLLRR